MKIAATAVALGFLAVVPVSNAQEITGDALAGADVFGACAACHNADEAKNKIGPYLKGVIGRPVASVESYKYTDAMRGYGTGGKVWDVQTLSHYLAAPRNVVPGTRMSFPGLKSEADIANIIAFLATTGQ